MSWDRDNIVRSMARRDYEDEERIFIPTEAEVIEDKTGYWVSCWIFIEKEDQVA